MANQGFLGGFQFSKNLILYARQNNQQTDITGDGTLATIINDTTISDPYSGYDNTTGIYTIPSTIPIFNTPVHGGIWLLCANVGLIGVTSAFTTINFRINTSNVIPISTTNGSTADASGQVSLHLCAFANGLQAGGTIVPRVLASGSTKTISTISPGANWTDFAIYYFGPEADNWTRS